VQNVMGYPQQQELYLLGLLYLAKKYLGFGYQLL
jgi:hypothetical protein